MKIVLNIPSSSSPGFILLCVFWKNFAHQLKNNTMHCQKQRQRNWRKRELVLVLSIFLSHINSCLNSSLAAFLVSFKRNITIDLRALNMCPRHCRRHRHIFSLSGLCELPSSGRLILPLLTLNFDFEQQQPHSTLVTN